MNITKGKILKLTDTSFSGGKPVTSISLVRITFVNEFRAEWELVEELQFDGVRTSQSGSFALRFVPMMVAEGQLEEVA